MAAVVRLRRAGITRGLIAAIAAAVILAALAVSASASGAPPTGHEPDASGLGPGGGPDLDLDAARLAMGDAAPGAPPTQSAPAFSGAGLLRRGIFMPLADFPGAVGLTGHVGLNNRGQVAGLYIDAQGVPHGFLRSPRGRFSSVDVPGASATAVSDVNERGQVGGVYADAGFFDPTAPENPPPAAVHGFVRNRDGKVKKVDVPGAAFESVTAINNHGVVVGDYVDAQGVGHSFRLERGVLTTIDPRPSRQTFVSDINDRGQMVGSYADERGTYHGFLLDRRARLVTTLDPPGAADVPGIATSHAFGINRRGQVVGQYVDAGSVLHGYLWRKGAFKTVDPPGGGNTVAADIDDRGRILFPAPGPGSYRKLRNPMVPVPDQAQVTDETRSR